MSLIRIVFVTKEILVVLEICKYMSSSEHVQAFVKNLFSRIIILIGLLIAADLPISNLIKVSAFVVCVSHVLFAQLQLSRLLVLIYCAVIIVSSLTYRWITSYKLEESHNIYLALDDENVFDSGLPLPVASFLRSQFRLDYPEKNICNKAIYGCWAHYEIPNRVSAFSADDIFFNAGSRRTFNINFRDIKTLRLGDINNSRYDWFDVDKFKNGEKLDLERDEAPFFVSYTFRKAYIGSMLCWKGIIFWEKVGGDFVEDIQKETNCKTIGYSDIDKKVFGISLPKSFPLEMRLQQNSLILSLANSEIILSIVSMLMIVFFAFKISLKPMLISCAWLLTIFYNTFYHPSWFNSMAIMEGGNDGLVHLGLARKILENFVSGNFIEALRGGEDVYYFMPGLRYFRFFELVVFGDSLNGYLVFISFMPVIVFMFFYEIWSDVRRPIREIISVILLLVFWIGILPIILGIWYEVYLLLTYKGYAEPLGYMFFISALLMLLVGIDKKIIIYYFVSGALFSFSIFVRPNVVIGVLSILIYLMFCSKDKSEYCWLLYFIFGLSIASIMPIHNYLFGNRFVLFTAAATLKDVLILTPYIYFKSIINILLYKDPEYFLLIKNHILEWVGSEISSAFIVKVCSLASIVTTLSISKMSQKLKILAVSAFGLQITFLFYPTIGRYSFLAWFLSSLVLVRLVWETVIISNNYIRKTITNYPY